MRLLSPEQIRKICEEELFADIYAGIDNFNTRELRDSANRRNMTAEERKNTPPDLGDENTVFAEGAGNSFDLKEFNDGRRFVDVNIEQNRFDGLSDNEKQKLAEVVIKTKFAQKVIGLDNRAFVNGTTAGEYGHPIKQITDSTILDAKMRALTEMDNLLDAGFNFRMAPDGQDGHVHPNAAGDFRYFDTIFKVRNEYYPGAINIMPTNKGLLLKDVTKIRNVTQDISSSYGTNPKSRFLRNVSMDSILQSSENSNPQNEGRASVEVGEDNRADAREEIQRLRREQQRLPQRICGSPRSQQGITLPAFRRFWRPSGQRGPRPWRRAVRPGGLHAGNCRIHGGAAGR